jgi:hypothetical protein
MSKANEWREVERRERGLYLSPPGQGGQTFAYACVVYEVTETRAVNGTTELRTRTVDGAPLYEHEAPHLAPWYKVLRVAMGEVAHDCRKADGAKAKRRKGKR